MTPPAVSEADGKRCPDCGIVKPRTDYYEKATRYCKRCTIARQQRSNLDLVTRAEAALGSRCRDCRSPVPANRGHFTHADVQALVPSTSGNYRLRQARYIIADPTGWAMLCGECFKADKSRRIRESWTPERRAAWGPRMHRDKALRLLGPLIEWLDDPAVLNRLNALADKHPEAARDLPKLLTLIRDLRGTVA